MNKLAGSMVDQAKKSKQAIRTFLQLELAARFGYVGLYAVQ